MIATFVFYNKSHGKQAKLAFSKDLVHSNIIIEDGSGSTMIMFEMDGIRLKRFNEVMYEKLFLKLPKANFISATIRANIDQRKRFKWFPWWARTCNEVCRYASGIDIGFTFNPRHLYNKLLKYDGKRNYIIVSQWRRMDELSIRELSRRTS